MCVLASSQLWKVLWLLIFHVNRDELVNTKIVRYYEFGHLKCSLLGKCLICWADDFAVTLLISGLHGGTVRLGTVLQTGR